MPCTQPSERAPHAPSPKIRNLRSHDYLSRWRLSIKKICAEVIRRRWGAQMSCTCWEQSTTSLPLALPLYHSICLMQKSRIDGYALLALIPTWYFGRCLNSRRSSANDSPEQYVTSPHIFSSSRVQFRGHRSGILICRQSLDVPPCSLLVNSWSLLRVALPMQFHLVELAKIEK